MSSSSGSDSGGHGENVLVETEDDNVLEHLPKRSSRKRRRARFHDSVRAEKSLQEREKKQAFKSKKVKKSTPKINLPGRSIKVKNPTKLDKFSLKAANLQAKILDNLLPSTPAVNVTKPLMSSTPLEEVNGTPKNLPALNMTVPALNAQNEQDESFGSDGASSENGHDNLMEGKNPPVEIAENNHEATTNADQERGKNEAEANKSSSSDDSDDSDSEVEDNDPRKPKKLKMEDYLNQLRFTQKDDTVKELLKGSQIFVSLEEYQTLKERRNLKHTTIARDLLEMVFKTEALVNCSLQGKAQKGPLGKTERPRPGLYSNAVQTILSKAKLMVKDMGLKRLPATDVKKQMGTKLSEVRRAVRLEEIQRQEAAARREKKAAEKAARKAAKKAAKQTGNGGNHE